MKFDKYFPSERLSPYIKYLVVSESELAQEYKVFPSSGLVIGFQYKGQLLTLKDSVESGLDSAGITGMRGAYQTFKNTANIGTILVYFTEIGFTHFASHPANELFDLSLSLDHIFDKNKVMAVQEQLVLAASDQSRVQLVEQFLLSQLREIKTDILIVEAIRLIYQSKGTIRIKEFNEKLLISQSPLEKRFRKVVGTSAKKFAAIVRFNSGLSSLSETKTLAEICYENHFFDQAHFIKDFKQFTGDTPENFKRFL